MKLKTASILIAAITVISISTSQPGLAQKKSAARSTQKIGNILMQADEFVYYKPDKVVALGDVDFKGANKLTGVTYTANAKKIVVLLGRAPGAKPGGSALGAIKSAVFTGPVTITYAMPKSAVDDATGKTSQVMTNTCMKANEATYDGRESMAYLTGNVVITVNDPSMMEEPSVVTGEKASVNLNPNPASDEFSYKIETPNGVSRIEVTPKNEVTKRK